MSSETASSATFSLDPNSFTGYKLENMPNLEVELTKEDGLKIYKEMNMVRRLEMAADSAYKAKLIRGFCHLCTGQEAIPVGIEAAITSMDSIITSYRCHGFTYMRGVSPTEVLAELFGRRTGISNGKGGSMHMYGPNFFGGNGIVGAQVPLGAGLAFKHKYNGEKAISISLYGDGAANQGQVFESFNIAKLWNLPAVFICENNKYGMGTSASRASSNPDYYTRGDTIPGLRVNGMDVLAVRESLRFAKEWILEKNGGPIVLEMSTYRYGGHSMSDPGTTYRTREEVQHMRSTSDPITGLRTRLLGEQGGQSTPLVTEEELKAIDKQVKKDIDIAVAEAKASPEPEISELFKDVYVPGNGVPFLRGRTLSETHYF
ncbi:Pyruvate dehydrogenase E1 component subunit alpha, mitochondrial [Zancudomyces culisetae]|uniref:Pyruvate dehydrogenase E1 component subunit alpha n=1 Tax=Zancudomyces culisetae TaxID=1213189 RepID=A0A1R1PXI0_ZANCU|nr:Pyruvate dehydrogenase E1 component subunit alpha, mitochondrial [Zancudomyces culisetae]|eukprot:OMH85685.1 Pyruvate dehydrogenase E1 component subunit alpha, mitochondrial [Zancudomyces culisetae]